MENKKRLIFFKLELVIKEIIRFLIEANPFNIIVAFKIYLNDKLSFSLG